MSEDVCLAATLQAGGFEAAIGWSCSESRRGAKAKIPI